MLPGFSHLQIWQKALKRTASTRPRLQHVQIAYIQLVLIMALYFCQTVFPTRCSGDQLDSLRAVLWSAILARGMSAKELQKTVLKRLNRQNMDIGQQAYWLCAGLSVARDRCLPLLVDFLSTGREPRNTMSLIFL